MVFTQDSVLGQSGIGHLVTRAYKRIPEHWLALMPPFEIQIVSIPFDEIRGFTPVIRALTREYKRAYSASFSWEAIRFLTTKTKSQKIARMHLYCNRVLEREKEKLRFERDFLHEIGLVMWAMGPQLQEIIEGYRFILGKVPREEHGVTFMSSFPKYILEPVKLRALNMEVWKFMIELENLVRSQRSVKAPAALQLAAM
ncbi:MAG: hypothetical protein JWO00_486 [Candidatus Parcubacteria bacterium]|nr:hypothetical protein [Candidatus Parcubacteria bacterium]